MSSDFRGQILVGVSILCALALVGAYLAAGGSSYAPEQVRDPCQPREWRDPGSLQEIGEQISLSAADGAACELGVSREELMRALPTEETRERFQREYGVGTEEFARAIRAGLVRAIEDAERAGALSPLIAGPLRGTIEQIPLEDAVALVEDGSALFQRFQDFLGPAADLLEELFG